MLSSAAFSIMVFPLDDVNQRPVQQSGVEPCFLSTKDGLEPPKADIALGWVHPIIVSVSGYFPNDVGRPGAI
jgi:hypothetical protein